MKSAIYTGNIRHRRFKPVPHEFSYRLYLVYLDLDELDEVEQTSKLLSTRKRALAEFRRSDHYGDPNQPLKQSIEALVTEQTGYTPKGPIRLLTHLRYFGYVFNPVSFYYCFNETGDNVDCVVAEVNNTPWGEQHCYVLQLDQNAGVPVKRTSSGKAMHVSPFMPMDMQYDWRIGTPDESLNLHMANLKESEKIFDATLTLKKKPLSTSVLASSLIKYPLLTIKVMAAIHWQAIRLWLKRVPFHPHPDLEGSSQVQENSIR